MMIQPGRISASRAIWWRAAAFAILVLVLAGAAMPSTSASDASLAPVADTYVTSGQPSQSHGSEPGLWVGYDEALGNLSQRALLAFDVSMIPPGSRITSATLRLYLAGTTTGDAPMSIGAYRVRSGWTESLTWQGHLGLAIDGTPAASTSVGSTLGWASWDVQFALQTWSDKRDTGAFSLILKSEVTSGTHKRGFWSRDCSVAQCGSARPSLQVAYEPPPLAVSLKQTELSGARLRYDIGVTNPTARTASGAVVTAPIPKGTAFESATSGGSLVGAEVKWSAGTLAAAGGAWSGSYTVRLAPASALTAGGPAEALGAGSDSIEAKPPRLRISKTPATQQVLNGGTASFTIQVVNSGGENLTGVQITDPLTPDCDRTVGDLAVDQSFGPYTCALASATTDFVNVVTVAGDPPTGGAVTDSASAAVDVINPAIQISKTPGTQTVAAGGAATFTIAVSNPGDVGLTGVVVSDPLAPNCARSIGALAAGASYPAYTCSVANVQAAFTNTATATGTPPVGADVTASDTAAVTVIHPAIQISKGPDTQSVLAQGTANFNITVTNSGDSGLTNVAVTDPLTPNCSRTIGTLAAGASSSYSCSLAGVASGLTNIATATGTPPQGPKVSASDTAVVTVLGTPGLRISKTPGTQQVAFGGAATFTIAVTNSGGVALTNVAVSDPLAPDCARSIGALAAGATSSYTCSRANVQAAFTNTATAAGTTPVGSRVSATSSGAAVSVKMPVILNPGACVSWTYAGDATSRQTCSGAVGGLPLWLPVIAR